MGIINFLGKAFQFAILIFKSWFQANDKAKKVQKEAISKAVKASKKKDLKKLAEAIDEYNAQ